MAYEEAKTVVSFPMSSTADFSTRNYHFVGLQTDGDAELATTAGQFCIGVAQDAPSTALASAALPVAIGGVSKIWYASSTGSTASVAIGDPLQTHTNGQAIVATTADQVIGYALTAHSSNAAKSLGQMLIAHGGIY